MDRPYLSHETTKATGIDETYQILGHLSKHPVEGSFFLCKPLLMHRNSLFLRRYEGREHAQLLKKSKGSQGLIVEFFSPIQVQTWFPIWNY